MMRIAKIIFLIITLGLTPRFSYCQSFESHSATMESARLDLTGDTLTAINVDAFEQRGIQKIKDFNSYIQIITDHSYDQSLRDHASTLALQLFVSRQANINSRILFKNKNVYTIDKWLEKLKQEQTEALKITITNIEIKQKLTLHEDGMYHGSIAYGVTYSKSINSKTIEKADVLVDIQLKRVEEKIGNNSIKAWKVFLYSIK